MQPRTGSFRRVREEHGFAEVDADGIYPGGRHRKSVPVLVPMKYARPGSEAGDGQGPPPARAKQPLQQSVVHARRERSTKRSYFVGHLH